MCRERSSASTAKTASSSPSVMRRWRHKATTRASAATKTAAKIQNGRTTTNSGENVGSHSLMYWRITSDCCSWNGNFSKAQPAGLIAQAAVIASAATAYGSPARRPSRSRCGVGPGAAIAAERPSPNANRPVMADARMNDPWQFAQRMVMGSSHSRVVRRCSVR